MQTQTNYENAGWDFTSTWEIPGALGTADSVESVCVIYGASEDEVWISLARTINGSTVRYIERFSPRNWGTDKDDCFFVDSGLTYDSTAATTISGLTHLNGETVQVLADGAVHPDCLVASGSITLNYSASTVQIGLPYTSTVKPMKIDLQGLGLSTTMRIHKVIANFYQTLGGLCGPATNNMDRLIFRTAADPMDASPPIYTGTKEFTYTGGFSRTGDIIIQQDQPLPMTLLSLTLLLSADND
jgi:hypothetical protein